MKTTSTPLYGLTNPLSPPLRSPQQRPQGHPAKSKFLAVSRVGLNAPEIWICSCGGLRPTHTQCVYHALRKIRNLEEDFCPPRILSVRLRRMASWPEILFCTPGRQASKIAKIAKIAKEGCAGGGVCRWRKSAAILRISSALFLDCLCKILKQLMPSW